MGDGQLMGMALGVNRRNMNECWGWPGGGTLSAGLTFAFIAANDMIACHVADADTSKRLR